MYSNTDSLLVYTRDIEKFKLGSDLGDFKVELTCKKFICLAPKKYLYVLSDGTLKNCFGKPSVEWFEGQLREEV
jgi:hypothetical protein